jgi:hypothetical protein
VGRELRHWEEEGRGGADRLDVLSAERIELDEAAGAQGVHEDDGGEDLQQRDAVGVGEREVVEHCLLCDGQAHGHQAVARAGPQLPPTPATREMASGGRQAWALLLHARCHLTCSTMESGCVLPTLECSTAAAHTSRHQPRRQPEP